MDSAPKYTYESNSNESLKTEVFYEYSSDSKENHGSPLSKAYFDNAENLPSPKESGASSNPISPLLGNKINTTQCDKNLDKSSRNGVSNLAEISKPSLGSADKAVQSLVPEMMYKTCRGIETDYTPMYELNYTMPKTNRNVMPDNCRQNLGYMDCNSDEFADVEDNSADSTAEDREFSSNASKPNCRLNGAYVAGKLEKERGNEDKIVLRKAGIERSTKESVRSKVAGNNNSFPKPSCSHAPQSESKTFPVEAISQPSKNARKDTMNTIVEVPELEGDTGNPKTRQPPVSKTNPLKMKSSVGSKKTKCNVCNARLGLCAISCRCGGYYCAKHRYDREHNCTFDYKSMGAEEIRRNNPQIIAEKVRKL